MKLGYAHYGTNTVHNVCAYEEDVQVSILIFALTSLAMKDKMRKMDEMSARERKRLDVLKSA